MSLKKIKIASFFFICILLFIARSHAQATHNEKHIEVSLRMIGHQILIHSNDTTSRVLPIIKENGQYLVKFESEFAFNPEELVSTVDSIVKVTEIANNYIVEVINCETEEVVYSFEMDDLEKSDIIPCKSRIQPKSCYSLLFTLIETKETSQSNNYIIIALIAIIAVIVFVLSRRNNKSTIDPNWIPLGLYYFDKRNTELIIEQQRIELTSKEADLLFLLYEAANTTVKREVILNIVWGDEGDYVGRTLDVFISKLRKKLEFDSKIKIVNIRGIGYKLILDV